MKYLIFFLFVSNNIFANTYDCAVHLDLGLDVKVDKFQMKPGTRRDITMNNQMDFWISFYKEPTLDGYGLFIRNVSEKDHSDLYIGAEQKFISVELKNNTGYWWGGCELIYAP